MKKIAVSIVVYNEQDSLQKTLTDGYKFLKSLNKDFDLWIFNNCSTDNTEEIINNFAQNKEEIKHFKQSKNVGYGLNAFSAIKTPKADYIFVIDGDGQYDFNDILILLKKLKNGNDVVFGWRKDRKDTKIRKITTFCFNILAKIILNSSLQDINCGFKGFNNNASSKINTNYNYNYIGPEIYIQSKFRKLKVGQCEVRHYDRIGGTSYFNGYFSILINALIMIKYLIQLRIRYILKNFDEK
jgi:glycosyltransferase involved in cell wall biosynthesis